MDKFKSILHTGAGLAATAAVILILVVLFSLVIGGVPRTPTTEPLAGQVTTDTPAGALPTDQTQPTPFWTETPAEAYPPPADQNPPTPVWTDTPESLPSPTVEEEPSFPDTPPAPAGKAATLFKGNVWMVEPGTEPKQLTAFGDVSAIFGWNRDGTKLLIGRGRNLQPEFTGDTTDLWILDVRSQLIEQFTSSMQVQSAVWSPIDDRIAYCELGNILTIASTNGEILQSLDQVLCEFNWSPDGTAVAVDVFTPDMIASDGLKFNTIGVWWLSTNKLQTFSEAKDEVHLGPIWSIDNCCILFLRISYDPALKDMYWWHVINIAEGEIKTLENTPKYAQHISRSSYSNTVTFQSGEDIYIMDFDGNYQFIDKGSLPIWLSDGRSLIYQEQSNSNYLSRSFDIPLEEIPKGGQRYSINLYEIMSPKYFFMP